MPVSKSKRKKKRLAQPPARPAPDYDFTDDFDPADLGLADLGLADLDLTGAELDEALAAELDTEAAVAELKKAGKAFRPATLEAAEQLILQGLRSHDPQRQLDLALKAFELCPWCADAYGVLAMRAQDHPRMALHFRRIALAAAEFALDADWGEDLREAYSENYWGHAATRAYMRARAGLAQTLADGGALAEAADHLETLLRFNPNDEQGLRYPLAEHLLMLGRDKRLVELLLEFAEEDSAFVGFNFSLVAFRAGGDTKESRVVLDAAIAMNPHAAPYLLGRRATRPASTEAYEPGSEDEAMLYAECTVKAWRSTQGALDWLRQNTAGKY